MHTDIAHEYSLETGGRRLNVVSCQLRPEPRDVDENLQRVLDVLDLAPAGSLVVTPELYLSGYLLSGVEEFALTCDAPQINRLRDACARNGKALVLGFVEAEGGHFFNSLLVIDETGKDLLCYRKTHLYPGEDVVYEPGDALAKFEVQGISIGLLNCYEVELPEPARFLVAGGCEVLLTSSSNMRPYFRDHRVAVEARALENRVHHVYVNQVGQGEELYFVGGSRWVRPDGTTGYEAEGEVESLAFLSFELQDLKPWQADFLASRRQELYS